MVNKETIVKTGKLLVFPILLAVFLFTSDWLVKGGALILFIAYATLFVYSNFLNRKARAKPYYESDYKPLPRNEFEEDQFLTPENQEDVSSSRESDDGFVILGQASGNIAATGFTKPKDRGEIPGDFLKQFNDLITQSLAPDKPQEDQFGFILERVLQIAKEAFAAHSVLYLWYNKKRNTLSIDRWASSTADVVRHKIPLGADVLSKIVLGKEPLFFSEIPPAQESEKIAYYSHPQNIRCFAGVPVIHEGNLIGVLAIDSKESDRYGVETIYMLARFVRLITFLIKLFEERYNESLAQARLQSLLGFLAPLKTMDDERELLTTIDRTVQDIIHWDAFAFVLYVQETQKFKTVKVSNRTSLKYIGENLEVELENTIVGKAVLSSLPVRIDDAAASEYRRYTKTEDVTFEGSFLAVPLTFQEQTYGVLCFESFRKNLYSNSDIDFLQKASGFLSFILYAHATNNLLKSYLGIDVDTKMLNLKAFQERLHIDLARAQSFNAECSLALLRIDNFVEQESLFEDPPMNRASRALANIITNEMNEFANFGKLNERLFGVFFFNANSRDAALWAEKIRQKITRMTISLGHVSTGFSISAGIASGTGVDSNELMNNAKHALHKAMEAGGNRVKNIN